MKKVPSDKEELLTAFARETARMSYPGQMHPIVKAGMKEELGKYFTSKFPMEQIWDDAAKVVLTYDQWHNDRVNEIAKVVSRYKRSSFREIPRNYNSKVIAAKFLNTFMYQLMKFENCRPLFKYLHLPLDRRVFDALRSTKLSFSGKEKIQAIIRKSPSPYTIKYSGYKEFQNALWSVVKVINKQPGQTITLTSRIELNCFLWSFDDKN